MEIGGSGKSCGRHGLKKRENNIIATSRRGQPAAAMWNPRSQPSGALRLSRLVSTLLASHIIVGRGSGPAAGSTQQGRGVPASWSTARAGPVTMAPGGMPQVGGLW
jgi:hypothetical protein